MSKKVNRTKCFSVLIALLPLLSYYNSLIPSVDMGSFLLIIFSIFTISIVWYKSDFMLLYLYVLIITPLFGFLLTEQNIAILTMILRYIKFVVILGCVFGLGFFKKYYDEQMAFKTMKYIIYICAVFIILQRVFYFFGIIIENPLIRFATNDVYKDGYSMGNSFLFRPSAFFLEPSHLSVYGLAYLVYSLFRKGNLKQSLIVYITILCSGSGIGLVFGIMTYCAYFLIRLRKHTMKILVAMCVGTVAIIGMSRITFFKNVVNRFTTDNIAGGGNAIQGRIGIGYQLFLEKDWWQQLFGSGYGNVPADIYLNGITYILNALGVIGFIIFLWLILRYMREGETWQKIGILIVLGLSIVSQVFTPASLAFYFCVYNNQLLTDKAKQVGAYHINV